MNVSKDKVVKIHYTLKDVDGNVLDSSVGKEPLEYLHGNGFLIVGLERELEGKNPGDKFDVTIQPEDAYGKYDEALILDVQRSQFETNDPIEVGMQFQVMTPQGPSIVTVIEVTDDIIKINGNHELAGKVLHFDVEVVDVRELTQEEIDAMKSGCGGCGGGCGDSCDGDCGGCGGCH